MDKLVFATHNAHKLEELRRIAGDKLQIVGLDDIGCREDIPETADTLRGNALQKAQWVKERYGVDCFADDTGLEVEALDGAPGVHSARYCGGEHDSEGNMALLLKNMQGKENRRARFVTEIALIEGENPPRFFTGEVQGVILEAPLRGGKGFGYDPVFRPDCRQEGSFATMTADEKNAVSHRGRAVEALMKYLKTK
ncbi:MAG: RdgB/HAM1 family non-canonical purine NTP pyrophosphatase [Muribaculaceae bacterium]|nr:RdgB/HAM1 family non-canonical purine NTP pyrophosphatase [Muribaculaceae bacterium]